MTPKKKPTRVTKGEKRAAKAELGMLKNPQSGDPEFEAFQEAQRKKHRPVREAMKDVRFEWDGLALALSPDKGYWNEYESKIQDIRPDDNMLQKVARTAARVTPAAVLTSAAQSGAVPYAIWPTFKGSSDVAKAVGGNIRKKIAEKKDVKAIARGTKLESSDAEKKRAELVRARLEKRGMEQEERDRKKYGLDKPSTYSFGFGGKFKK